MTLHTLERASPATVTALAAGHALSRMAERGMDYGIEARRLGLPATLVPEFEWRVPLDALDALFERGIETLGPDFPIAARPSPEDNRSPVNLYCRTRSSVRAGFSAMTELMSLVSDGYYVTLEEGPSGAWVVWSGPSRQGLWWFDLADMFMSIRTVIGDGPLFLRVISPFPAPPSACLLFDCPVEHGQRFAALLSPSLVERTLTVDPALSAMTSRWLSSLRPVETQTSSVLAALRALGPTATVGQLADSLGVSERTLHRRLSDSGTSFRAELDIIRAELAQTMIGTRSVDEIAEILGYSDSRAYRRAARRWGGDFAERSLQLMARSTARSNR